MEQPTASLSAKSISQIPLDLVKAHPDFELRPAQTTSERYMNILTSMRGEGQLTPIIVVADTDEGGSDVYYIITGTQRTAAARELGWDSISAIVRTKEEMAGTNLIVSQMAANYSVPQTPSEYCRALCMMQNELGLSLGQMCDMTHLSARQVRRFMKLDTIQSPEILEAIDGKGLTMDVAHAIAMLPSDEQDEAYSEICGLSGNEALELLAARNQAASEARSQGRKKSKDVFEPKAKLRKGSELIAIANGEAAVDVPDDMDEVSFIEGIKWCVMLDKVSVEAALAEFNDKKAQAILNAAKKKEERINKRAQAVEQDRKEMQMTRENEIARIEGRELPHPAWEEELQKRADEARAKAAEKAAAAGTTADDDAE